MVDLIHCPTNVVLFDVPLLYCYTNHNSSIICRLSSEDISVFFGASILSFCNSLESSSIEHNCVWDFFETLVILSAILLPINHHLNQSALFWIALFEVVFIASA